MHLFKPPPLKLMCLSLIDAVSVNKNHTLPFNVVFLRTRLSIAKKRGLPINLKILPVISIKAFIFQTSLPTQTQFIFYHSHQLIYWPFPVHTWPFCHCIIYSFHFNSYRFFKVQSSFYLFFFFLPSLTILIASPNPLIPSISLNPICTTQPDTLPKSPCHFSNSKTFHGSECFFLLFLF